MTALCDATAWGDTIAPHLSWIRRISIGATFGYTLIQFLKILHWLPNGDDYGESILDRERSKLTS